MEYIYAALLLHDAGKEITEEGIAEVIKAAGIEVDMGRVKALVNALSDVNIDEAVTQASSMPTPVAPVEATSPASAQVTPPAKEEERKKEEKEEEKEEETGMEGLASLFG